MNVIFHFINFGTTMSSTPIRKPGRSKYSLLTVKRINLVEKKLLLFIYIVHKSQLNLCVTSIC